MKTNNIWLFALLAMVIGWSCEEKDNMDPIGNWDINAPTPATPGPDATVSLDEGSPEEQVAFEWQPATTTNRFGVSYTFLLVPEGSDDFENALLRLTPGNAGKETAVAPTAEQIDYALWAACYPAGGTADLEWVIIARAIDKESIARQPVSIARFGTDRMPSTLFLYGSGSEAGEDAANAIAMRAIPDSEGNPSGVFDVYTSLTTGGTYSFRDRADNSSRLYGGADGSLEGCGPAIAAPETGQYRITVDLNNNTYELLKIDHWSLVGDAIEGGWGGDVPLEYKGNGVWSADVDLISQSGFGFRANADWSYVLKLVVGTLASNGKSGDVIMESEGSTLGVAFDNIPGALGLHTVTLDLSAEAHNYSLVEVTDDAPVVAVIGESTSPNGDAVSGFFNVSGMNTPDDLYLLSGDEVVAEFTKSGSIFTSENYVALEASKTYRLNTASDGSGEDVVGSDISVALDQAYRITVDFSIDKLVWKYYNLKLFHWDEVGGGWDARQELLMTYIHPYKFEVTGTLSAGFHSKFISPWDIQFGTDATALSGTMENGGDNFTGISQNGTYQATIEISEDYSTAEYSFVKQ